MLDEKSEVQKTLTQREKYGFCSLASLAFNPSSSPNMSNHQILFLGYYSSVSLPVFFPLLFLSSSQLPQEKSTHLAPTYFSTLFFHQRIRLGEVYYFSSMLCVSHTDALRTSTCLPCWWPIVNSASLPLLMQR